MRLRRFTILLAWTTVAWPQPVTAQQPSHAPHIGFLLPGSPDAYGGYVAAFLQGLSELGRVEGQNFVLDLRWAYGRLDRLPALAAELVEQKVEIMVVSSAGAAIAARKASTTIPIVQASGGDPVVSGVAESLARPGGNVTGMSNVAEDLSGKVLELLLQMAPGVSRFGVLVNPSNPTHDRRVANLRQAASVLRVEADAITASEPAGLDEAFEKIVRNDIGAMVVLSDGMFLTHRHRIVELMGKARVPAIYQIRAFVTDGGLMSYGINIGDNYLRAAVFVDRILKGAKPADLPIQHPTTYELVINLKTAEALGQIVPPTLLVYANEIIR
jgi:putative ABC transport system substrate-binding protein